MELPQLEEKGTQLVAAVEIKAAEMGVSLPMTSLLASEPLRKKVVSQLDRFGGSNAALPTQLIDQLTQLATEDQASDPSAPGRSVSHHVLRCQSMLPLVVLVSFQSLNRRSLCVLRTSSGQAQGHC
jgi:hypothetical protein